MRDISNHLNAPCFALYRMPGARTVHVISASEALTGEAIPPFEPYAIPASEDVKGFLIAPFDHTQCERLYIPAQKHNKLYSYSIPHDPQPLSGYLEDDRQRYVADFQACKQALATARALKLVLARCVRLRLVAYTLDIIRLFGAACEAFPNNYIALWHTPQTGTWLTATPELLLSRTADQLCNTMALAGTMPVSDPDSQRLGSWSKKNREEQSMVQQHIFRVLMNANIPYEVSDTKLLRSGNLVHLCTRFHSTTPASISALLDELHPTPAVCGMPVRRAFSRLSEMEHIHRDYYAGYSGPMLADGTFHFFVTLRCLHLVEQGCDLYAGSGLMPSSQLEDEWQETQHKLQALLQLMPLRG